MTKLFKKRNNCALLNSQVRDGCDRVICIKMVCHFVCFILFSGVFTTTAKLVELMEQDA